MRTITAILMSLLFLAAFSPVVSSRADDQDDGIAIDDGVQSYDQISKSSQNFSYLAQRARSKAASGGGHVLTSDNGILNSVILESGAEINGDIIIIDDSKGDKTIISQ
jgi:uncharacterized protein YdaL